MSPLFKIKKLRSFGVSIFRQYGALGVFRRIFRRNSPHGLITRFRLSFDSYAPKTKRVRLWKLLFTPRAILRFRFVGKVMRERGILHIVRKAFILLRAGTFFSYLRHIISLQHIKIAEDTQILLVANDLSWVSHIYRGYVFQQALTNLGFKVDTISESDIANLFTLPASVRCIYFFRTGTIPEELTWWESTRDSIVIGYDTDDLIFDSEIYTIENVSGLKNVDLDTYKHLTGRYLQRQQLMISEADILSSPTSAICDAYKKIASGTTVRVPNIYLDSIEPYFRKQIYKNDDFVIGYASGTKTHDKDFQICSNSIWEFMQTNLNVQLEIVGYSPIEMRSIPINLRNRVNVIKPVPHNQLLSLIKGWSVNIAPLELNSFTNGKSELKFVHAALCGVPTIASPSTSFSQAISNGSNGLLADTSEDWISCLQNLYSNKNLRSSLGLLALETVQIEYTLNRVQEILQEYLVKLLELKHDH
jgi:glycosyltransferase involved in cell wall biosynthesis